eukprot:1756502-Rhodomonas_salina.3
MCEHLSVLYGRDVSDVLEGPRAPGSSAARVMSGIAQSMDSMVRGKLRHVSDEHRNEGPGSKTREVRIGHDVA